VTPRPSSAILWAAIEQRREQAFTSRSLAFATGLPVPIVSALLRRLADRGAIVSAGLAGQQAKGGLRATVWRLRESPSTAPTTRAETASATDCE
jgi:hypothetical protein